MKRTFTVKPRHWVNLITLALLALVIALAWEEIAGAWAVLGTVNPWILSLLVPVQFLSYCATGEVLFGYLRSKGEMKGVSWWVVPRISLELNFVHHVMPSAGVAGFSYLGWALRRYGVGVGRATMAQVVQVVVTIVSYTLILVVALVVLAFDHEINRAIIVTSGALIAVVAASVVAVVFATSDGVRLKRFAGWVTRTTNRVAAVFTRHRKEQVLDLAKVEHFFNEVHEDYVAIRDDRAMLIRPFLFSILGNICDISLLYIAFLSLGIETFNPAIVVIAFGLSSILGMASATPGGAGVYETSMVLFMASAGVPASAAIAGTLLARVLLLLGTLVFGYVFYHRTINQSHERPS